MTSILLVVFVVLMILALIDILSRKDGAGFLGGYSAALYWVLFAILGYVVFAGGKF